jgi:hypothetical protein
MDGGSPWSGVTGPPIRIRAGAGKDLALSMTPTAIMVRTMGGREVWAVHE